MTLVRSWILLLALLPIVSLGCGRQSIELDAAITDQAAEVEVEVTKVRRGDLVASLELTGNLLPRRRSVIVAEIDGVIESLPKPLDSIQITPEQLRSLQSIGVDPQSEGLSLDIGDAVPKGGVLVTLRPRDFELELSSAKAKLVKAQKDLLQLKAWRRPEEILQLQAVQSEAEARQKHAEVKLQRAESLRAKNALSQSEYDLREMEFRTAEANLDQAIANVAIANAGPTAPEIAVAEALVAQAETDVEMAQERLTKTVIYSPYDAVVTDRYVDVGDRLTALPRVEIMEIMDLSLVLAQVGVPERFLSNIHLGDRVRVSAEGVQTTVPGFVVLINDKVDHETRTFRTRVAVDNRQRNFRAGQLARVLFDFSSSRGTLVVPSLALVFAGGRAQVFVHTDGKVSLRSVKPGITDNGQTEILSGVSEGEQVVIDDPSILADGMAVRLRVSEAEPSGDG